MNLIFGETYCEADIDAIAEKLKPIFLEHQNVMFKGEVGAGKTTLIKALSKAFMVLDDVDSPTFSLVNEYEGEIGVYHFDLYRLKGAEELFDIGWEEYLNDNKHVWVEWPENALEAFDDDFLLVKIGKLDDKLKRKVEVWDLHSD
ncbi:MAG: tRNA (adenosine(37)-N6)-threonylcarbamoyltransferase complex ATPase subunit type 1 TsaE [Bacteroidia bacterium]